MSSTTSNEPVGIIGLGAVGTAITERLIRAGIEVFGPRRGRVEAFSAAGGQLCENSPAVAARVTRLILLVPSDAALSDVMDEIGPVLQPKHMIVGLGTHAVAAKVRARSIAERARATLLDGEVSGTPGMIRSGGASILLAGDNRAAEDMRETFECIVPNVTFVGDFGNAVRLKLLTNFLVGVHTLAAAESLRFAQRLGLDLHTALSAIGPSAGGSAMLGVRGRMMAEGRFDGGTMSSFLRYFDLLRESLGETDQGTGELFELAESLYRRAISDGHGERDIAAIFDHLNHPGSAARR